MDDFLHNLRSGKLKQQDRGRQNYADYKGPQRRGGNERRKPDYYAKVTSENFLLVKNSLDILTENQKRIADALAAAEHSQARIADALEAIAKKMCGHLDPADNPTRQSEPAEEIPVEDTMDKMDAADDEVLSPGIETGNKKLGNDPKSEMLGIIASMRAEGQSWEKIARHMDDQNIPTVSGKGKWRGQAIKKFWDANA